jgi:O-antigen ligase
MRYASAEEYANAKAEFALVWLVYGAGAAAVLALVAKPSLLAFAVLGTLFALVAWTVPELLLVLYLLIGPLKATDVGARLTAVAGEVVPVDLTVLTALALIGAIAVSLWRYRQLPFSIPAPALFFLALGLLLLLRVPGSPDPQAGLQKAFQFQVLSGLAFCAPLALVRTRASVYRAFALFVVVGLVIALTAHPAERSDAVLVLPGADNQIQVGLLLGLGIVAIVGYLWPASSGWLRLVWLPPAAFLLVKLVAAGGRSALVGTLLACGVALLCLLRSGGRDRLAAVALVGVLAALIPAAWVSSSPAVQDRYLVTIEGVRGGAGLSADGEDRALLADAAVSLFREHPTGVGTAGYEPLTGYEWPHNIALEVASELGIPGLAALIGLFAGIAVVLRRSARRRLIRHEVIGAATLLVLPLSVAFASFDLNGNRVLWFGCGLCLAVSRLEA